MSSVTMCDFCSATSRSGAEMKKVKLPRDVAPEALSAGAGDEVAIDVCARCRDALRGAIDQLITRHFGGGDINAERAA